VARLSLLRMMLTQPVGPQQLTPERHRGVARVRLLIVLAALLGDAAFYGLLRGDPRVDQAALLSFFKVLPLLGLDAVIILVCLRWSPGPAWRTVTMVGVVLEMVPTMWWLHLTGSVSSYCVLLPATMILAYRLGYDLRTATLTAATALVLQIGMVAAELRGLLPPAPLFVGGGGGVYATPAYVTGAANAICIVYVAALVASNYVMNRLHEKDLLIAAAREEARHGRHSGRLVGARYRLGEVIGRGGMGEVYQARDERARRDCAIKILHPHLVGETASLLRFRREAQVASKLGSPHIVQIYEAGNTEEGLPFIALELLVGEDLGQRLRRTGLLAPAELVPLVAQTAAGLEVAHAAGIVHRDLKPQNLFLVGDPAAPTVRILDFGVCKIRDDSDGLTQTADVIGTPGFMAPEQFAGDAHAIDARTDVFALGAICYRALCGVLPFGGGDLTRILYRIAHEHPAPVSLVKPGLPADLDAVLAIALAKAPSQRYATVAELSADLAQAAAGTLDAPRRERAAPLLAVARREQFPETPAEALAPTVQATGE
jgi:serine/threonine-protein kinase